MRLRLPRLIIWRSSGGIACGTVRLPRPRRGTDPARTTWRTPRRFPDRPDRPRPRTIPGAGCTPARGRPRPAPGTGSAGSRCGRCRRRRRPRRPRARTRGGASSAASESRQDRLGVRLPASTPQAWPVVVASSASAPIRSAIAASRPASSACAGGSKPRPGAPGGERVEVLRPADGARGGSPRRRRGRPRAAARGAGGRCWRAGRAHRRGPGPRAAWWTGQLAVHREARLVAQRLQDLELHPLTVRRPPGIFSRRRLFLFSNGHRAGRPPTIPRPPVASAAPSPEDVRRMLAGVMDPELHASIADLGMVRRRQRSTPTAASSSTSRSPRSAARSAPRSRRKSSRRSAGCPASREVKVHYVEMTQEQRTAAMQARALRTPRRTRPTPRSPRRPACWRSRAARVASARARSP